MFIFLGQNLAEWVLREIHWYAEGVPRHELPSWYIKLLWWQGGGQPNSDAMEYSWDFGHYAQVDEFLRQQGLSRLPFDTAALDEALRKRRENLGIVDASARFGVGVAPDAVEPGHGEVDSEEEQLVREGYIVPDAVDVDHRPEAFQDQFGEEAQQDFKQDEFERQDVCEAEDVDEYQDHGAVAVAVSAEVAAVAPGLSSSRSYADYVRDGATGAKRRRT